MAAYNSDFEHTWQDGLNLPKIKRMQRTCKINLQSNIEVD